MKINQDRFNKAGILILYLISISIYSGVVLVKHQNFTKMQYMFMSYLVPCMIIESYMRKYMLDILFYISKW